MLKSTYLDRTSKIIGACAFVTLLSMPSTAQTRVHAIVPASVANSDANARMLTHFAEKRARRVQILIGAEHLKGLKGKSIYKLAFRKDIENSESYDWLRGGEKTNMRVLASWSDAKPRAPGMDFRGNFGPQVTEVFRGDVLLPKVSTHDGRKSASFNSREAPTLIFKTPILHVPGKTLVLDFITFAGKGSGHYWVWPLDAESRVQRGTSRTIGKACWPSKHKAVANVMLASLRPGMHIKTQSMTPPSPLVAFLLFGFSDKTALGALPLPFKIAEPSCMLSVSPDVIVRSNFFYGFNAQSEGSTDQTIPTPQIPGLYGATLYFQYLFLHKQGSAIKLATSNGVAATFTKTPPSLGISVVANLDPTARKGRVFLDFGPVMRFSAK